MPIYFIAKQKGPLYFCIIISSSVLNLLCKFHIMFQSRNVTIFFTIYVMQDFLKGKVHLILPVTKDRLSSLLKTQNDINFGLAKTSVKP